MKRKSRLLTLCLAASLLVGCGNNNENQKPSDNSGEKTNNESGNKNTDDGGNTSEKEDGGNTTEKEDKKVNRVMTEETWKSMFSTQTLSNVKISEEEFYYPYDIDYMGPIVTTEGKYENVLTVQGNKFSVEIIKKDSKLSIKDAAFDAFVEEDSEMLADFDNDKEIAYAAYLSFFASTHENSNTTRNSTDDGYIIVSSLEKPYTHYFENIANNDIYDLYHYDLEDEKYTKKTIFTDYYDEDGNDLLVFYKAFCDLNDKFNKAKYIAEKGCYELDLSDLVEGDEEEQYDLLPIDFYFADGLLEKIVFDGTETDESYLSVLTFSDYGKTAVTLPSEFEVCRHEHTSYECNDNYHYRFCNDCNGIVEYESHHLVNSECDICSYIETVPELIYGSDGRVHAKFYKNSTTGEYVSGHVTHCDYSYNAETGENVYICEDGECDIRISYVYSTEYPTDRTLCYYYSIYTHSFYENGVKIHDDIVEKNKNIDHAYRLADMGEVCDTPYGEYYDDPTVYRGEIKCAKCGEVYKDVDIYLADSSLNGDIIHFSKPGYKDLRGDLWFNHDIDINTQKCIYCGKDALELNIKGDKPNYSFSFYSVDEDTFINNYSSEFTYDEYYSKLKLSAYAGNSVNGNVYNAIFNYAQGEWTSAFNYSIFNNYLYFTSTTSKSIIDNLTYRVISEGLNLTFAMSNQGIGYVEYEDCGIDYKFYFNEDALLVRYEETNIANNTVEQITFETIE